MDDKIRKHVEKTWYKVNGKLNLLDETAYGWQLIIEKTSGKVKKHFAFSFYASDSELLQKVQAFKKGDRLKCRFTIETKLYNGKWYTNLKLKDVLTWKVNEKKIARDNSEKKRNEEREYGQSLFSQNNDWTK